jgi:hypothetical protein
MRQVGGQILLTNYFGDFVFVSESELNQLTHSTLDESSELFSRLANVKTISSNLLDSDQIFISLSPPFDAIRLASIATQAALTCPLPIRI